MLWLAARKIKFILGMASNAGETADRALTVT
jgi:hypothetical protein